jgi:hypothetical protein
LRASARGKKTRSKTNAAADANTKKSYHSTIVPIELAMSRLRRSWSSDSASCGASVG